MMKNEKRQGLEAIRWTPDEQETNRRLADWNLNLWIVDQQRKQPSFGRNEFKRTLGRFRRRVDPKVVGTQ